MKKIAWLCLLLIACIPASADVEPPKIVSYFLPYIKGGGGGPTIYDCYGEEADEDWLREHFGDVTWQHSPGATLESVTCDLSGIAALIIHVESESQKVVIRYWPDAPLLPEFLQGGWYDRGVWGLTNLEGDIGFGMGFGDYYFPPDGGPGCIWVHPGGDLLCGLGMLGGTNHYHVNSGWRAE